MSEEGHTSPLAKKRHSRHLSQAKLAELVDTTPENVSRWERRITLPNPFFRQKLCEHLKVSEEELNLLIFSGKEDAPALPIGSSPNTLPEIPLIQRPHWLKQSFQRYPRWSLAIGLLLILSSVSFVWLKTATLPGNASQGGPATNPSPSLTQNIFSPTLTLTIPGSIPLPSRDLYNQVVSSSPTKISIPSNANGWMNGALAYGTCMDEGNQGYHAVTASSADTGSCVAPSPALSGDYAVQAEVVVQQGFGGGIVFGWQPEPPEDVKYNGNYYYFGYCTTDSANTCYPGNIYAMC
jgi:transcriptional regulator with XRE-family HTH domain